MTSARAFRLLLLLFIALHAWKVFRLLPIQRFSDGQPLVEYHYSQIYVDVLQDREFRKETGHSWGYDPYTGAGQISGAGLVPESHAVLLLDRFLRVADRPDTTIKIFAALALLAGPFLLFGAARMFRFSPEVSLLAAALLSAGMISHDESSRMLIYRGHITFWLSCFIALVNAASLYAWTLRPLRRFAVLFALTWPLLLLMDPAIAILQLVPTITLIVFGRERRAPAFLWLFIGVTLAVGVNAFWLAPYIRFHESLLPLSEVPSPGLEGLAGLFLPLQGEFYIRLLAVMRGLLFVLACAGLVQLKGAKRRLTLTLSFWFVSLIGFAMAGSKLPGFRTMEPGRLLFAATSVLLMPAALAAESLFIAPGSKRIVFSTWALWMMMTWQLVHPSDGTPLRVDLAPREQRLLADLRALPPSGRILVQYNPLFTDGLRLASLQRTHTFAGFPGSWWKSRGSSDGQFMIWEGQWYLFGHSLSSCTLDSTYQMLQAYNIAYVVTTAPKGYAFFAGLMGLEQQPSQGGGSYHIFAVPRARGQSYVMSGKGDLTFGYSRLHIRNAHTGLVVTSFRFADGFRTDPPMIVRSVRPFPDGPLLLALENKAGRSDIEVIYAGR